MPVRVRVPPFALRKSWFPGETRTSPFFTLPSGREARGSGWRLCFPAVTPDAAQTPRPSAARARVVVSFYGALAVVGFLWHGIDQDTNDIWRLDPTQDATTLLWTPAVGIAFGLVVVRVFRRMERHMDWLGELHREFRAIFGAPRTGELVLLAAASSVGEEILFRGAMLDAWGFWASSLVFALLHIPPRPRLWPWTMSALALGMALAGLSVATGNLGAAVAAHFVINLQNLAYITRNEPRPEATGGA